MNKSLTLFAGALLAGAALAASPTKSRTPPATAARPPAVAPTVAPATLPPQSPDLPEETIANHIVALVNSEPITNQEVHAQLARLQVPAGANLPPRHELLRQLMERLITERVQIQAATEQGLKIDEGTLAQAEDNVARQNGLSVAVLRQRLQAMGQDPETFRQGLRNELLLQRLREREVDAKAKVSEQDINQYLQEHQTSANTELHLAQILLRVPENASPAEAESVRQQALGLAEKARQGAPFAGLAQRFSDGPEKNQGGSLGLRPAERYPGLFVEATQNLQIGEVSAPVRSGAGFHVLTLLEKRYVGLPDLNPVQTQARHILLRTGPTLGPEAAQARLETLRQQVLSGQASFASLAKQHSQDGSASNGGDLGWAKPGMFVPEFEEVMNRLAINEVSAPFMSRFGAHILQVQARQRTALGTRELRDWVRNALREQKIEQAQETWLRELRGRAYIEYRDPPQ